MEPQETIQDTVQDTQQEPQAGTLEHLLEKLKGLEEMRRQLEGTGFYVLLPTEALLKRSEVYFYQCVEDVARLLGNAGITEDVAEMVKADYAAVVAGIYDVKLPLKEQAHVVNTVNPWRLQFAERYALTLLFTIYFRNTTTAKDYINNFKNATGEVERVTLTRGENGETVTTRERMVITVEEQKNQYVTNVFNRITSGFYPLLAASYSWIKRNKIERDGELIDIIEPSDFSGVEPEKVNKFLGYIEAYAGIDDYANYYYIAKYALRATPDELKEIDFPPIFKEQERAQEYAERIAEHRYKNIREKSAEVEKMIAADTVEETERAKQEIKTETADTVEETIRIPETFALLGSRDVYASVDGTPQMTQGILPIQAFITDYMARHHLTEQVTPRTVEKVIEGVNLLQRLYNVKPNEKGQYTFDTNISEFSELIGYKDANQTQKLEIMRALQILDGLYLAVWRSNGLEALRVFTIQRIGLSGELTGQLTLQVNANAMKGRPNLISYKDFDDMRKDAKGQAKTHFRGQITAKGQKEENALLNEVFGYEVLLQEIELSGGTAEDIAKAKKNISGHKSRDKRRIAKWFEEYKQRGWLEWYTYTRNAKGEYIYKWRRGNIPKDVFTTSTPQEPEEQ